MSDENRVNIFDQDAEDRSYPDLADTINFAGFGFDVKTYQREEVEVLQPQLEALGYTNIEWLPGETDSFGPLTRLCKTINPDGNEVTFIYG